MKEPPMFFDIMLHFGTLLAVVVYFSKDIWKMVQGTGTTLKGKKEGREEAKLFLWIILATIPTGLMGIFFKDWFESLFSKPNVVGGMLLITGMVLWLTQWTKKEGRPLEQMRWIDSILIGIAQGLAIIPGISRSGATISTGLFCGLDRQLSGKFSFLLSIPAILGAFLLEFKKTDFNQELWTILIGTSVAFAVGFFSLKFLMNVIKVGQISRFSYYCWAVGIVMILFGKQGKIY
jgi:undecaprenyl-diphosphatase